MSAWDFGPGNVDDTPASFDLSGFLNGFKSTVTDLTGAFSSVKTDLTKAGILAPSTRQDDATTTPASNSKTLIYLGLGLAVIYFIKRG